MEGFLRRHLEVVAPGTEAGAAGVGDALPQDDAHVGAHGYELAVHPKVAHSDGGHHEDSRSEHDTDS